MNTHADKASKNKSLFNSNGLEKKQSNDKSTFPLIDNRPRAITQRKTQELINNSPKNRRLKIFQQMANNSHSKNYPSQPQPIQNQKGKKAKRQKGKKEPISVSKPLHSQERIQEEMIFLWKKNADYQDKLLADYAWKYIHIEDGWCDGWSYVLSLDNNDVLAELWAEIDNLPDGSHLNSHTSIFNACTLAKMAFLYHVMNEDAPTETEQKKDYESANFGGQKPSDRETWKHDEESTLEIHVIREEIESLLIGQTLRLTSPTHDAAVKRIKSGYIVCETESHGVQKCNEPEEALLILKEWQEECKKNGANFFNQSMIKKTM